MYGREDFGILLYISLLQILTDVLQECGKHIRTGSVGGIPNLCPVSKIQICVIIIKNCPSSRTELLDCYILIKLFPLRKAYSSSL